MARVLSARKVLRLIVSLMVTTRPSQKRNWTMPGCWLRKAKPERQLRLSYLSLASPLCLKTLKLIGAEVPQVEPLGFGQVHQSHASNRVSPAANVLLVPSVTSRIDVVPPPRHMMPVWVVEVEPVA